MDDHLFFPFSVARSTTTRQRRAADSLRKIAGHTFCRLADYFFFLSENLQSRGVVATILFLSRRTIDDRENNRFRFAKNCGIEKRRRNLEARRSRRSFRGCSRFASSSSSSLRVTSRHLCVRCLILGCLGSTPTVAFARCSVLPTVHTR